MRGLEFGTSDWTRFGFHYAHELELLLASEQEDSWFKVQVHGLQSKIQSGRGMVLEVRGGRSDFRVLVLRLESTVKLFVAKSCVFV